MNKNTKLILVLLAIVILAVIIIIGAKFIIKPEYTLKEIATLIDKSSNLPQNIYIKSEMIDCKHEGNKYIDEIYSNSNRIRKYSEHRVENLEEPIQSLEETIYDFENETKTHIEHDIKKITNYKLDENDNLIALTYSYYSNALKNEKEARYKYLCKENINNKEIIKFSLMYDNNTREEIYYIDIQDKNVNKVEYYTKENDEFILDTIVLYTYSYGTVTDQDVYSFDISKYPDYKFEDKLNESN